jgi:transposase
MSNIPLLPTVVKPVKDAARAARKGARRLIRKVTEVTVTQLLNLPGLRAVGYEVEQRGDQSILHLLCVHREEVAVCPRCHRLSTQCHEEKARCVRDLDIWGKCTFLHVPSRRFACEHCQRPFTESLSWIDSQRRHSRRFEQQIYRRCLDSTVKAVAQEAFLHEATVKGIFKRQAQRITNQPDRPRVRILGIDEIALKKRHKQYALVLSDLQQHTVIAVLPERSKDMLEQWFKALSPAERKAIRVVSIDMWEAYRQAVRNQLPHAQVVADRFHVVKQLNERLTQMRRVIQQQADEDTRQILKGSRWLLVRNREELSDEEESQLQAVLAASPKLRTLYLLKEEFHTIGQKIHDRRQAERFLRAWIWKAESTGDRFLRKFVHTLHNWWEEILNYFEERITNGFVEGINRAIRAIINRAYGFRNFIHFRLQVLAQHGSAGALSH